MNDSERKDTALDKLHEECGVFGIYDFDGNDVAAHVGFHVGVFKGQVRILHGAVD